MLTAFALAFLCGCGSVRVDEATSTYTRIGCASGTIAFGFGGPAAFGLLAVLVTLFQLVFSQSARDSFSEDDKKAISVMLPAFTGALLSCGLVYYDAVSNVVTLSQDGFTVRHLTRADEVVRFDEISKLEIVYMQSGYTGGGATNCVPCRGLLPGASGPSLTSYCTARISSRAGTGVRLTRHSPEGEGTRSLVQREAVAGIASQPLPDPARRGSTPGKSSTAEGRTPPLTRHHLAGTTSNLWATGFDSL